MRGAWGISIRWSLLRRSGVRFWVEARNSLSKGMLFASDFTRSSSRMLLGEEGEKQIPRCARNDNVRVWDGREWWGAWRTGNCRPRPYMGQVDRRAKTGDVGMSVE